MDKSAQHARNYKNRVVSTLKNFGAPALIAGSGIGTAGLIDAAINDELNRAVSKRDGLVDFLEASNGVEGAWQFVQGDEPLAPIHRQSIAHILSGTGDDMDIAILGETDALPRVERVMQARPDLAPILGMAMQNEVDLIVSQLEHGISKTEMDNGEPMNHVAPLAAGLAAGGAMTAGLRRL